MGRLRRCSIFLHVGTFLQHKVMALLRPALRVAARQSRLLTPQVRPFAGTGLKPNFLKTLDGEAIEQKSHGKALAERPFPGASNSEPEMEYIPEQSMTYMVCLISVPMIFQFWFLTNYC